MFVWWTVRTLLRASTSHREVRLEFFDDRACPESGSGLHGWGRRYGIHRLFRKTDPEAGS